MTTREFQDAVRRLFESGEATDEQWDELTMAVINRSEGYDDVRSIDAWVEHDLGVEL